MLAGMTEPEHVRLVVDVHRDGTSISGRTITADGVDHEFFGWTALASTVEAAIADTQPAAGPLAGGE
jgi:hypothetical protein